MYYKEFTVSFMHIYLHAVSYQTPDFSYIKSRDMVRFISLISPYLVMMLNVILPSSNIFLIIGEILLLYFQDEPRSLENITQLRAEITVTNNCPRL